MFPSSVGGAALLTLSVLFACITLSFFFLRFLVSYWEYSYLIFLAVDWLRTVSALLPFLFCLVCLFVSLGVVLVGCSCSFVPSWLPFRSHLPLWLWPVLDVLAHLCFPSVFLLFCWCSAFRSICLRDFNFLRLARCFYFSVSCLSFLPFALFVLLSLVPGISGRRLVQDFQHHPLHFPLFACLFSSAFTIQVHHNKISFPRKGSSVIFLAVDWSGVSPPWPPPINQHCL